MDTNVTSPWGFEFVDIEIIDHKKQNEERKRFNCDQCSLFFVDKEKLKEHKKKHATTPVDDVKCKYCNKVLYIDGGKESYMNKKCETCEYRCSKCPQRFLRYSSLVNHEKNHTLKKKKNVLRNKKHIIRVKQRNDKILKMSRKKQIQKVKTDENNVKVKEVPKAHERLGISPKKKQKLQRKVPLLEDSVSNVNKALSSNNMTPKRPSLMDNETDEDEKSVTVKNRQRTSRSAVETTTLSDDNVVNYKPFSCHICGDTFASQNFLLSHIQSHGENTDQGFKCKHCNKECDDIYQMQFHLALCTPVEDEVEFALTKNLSSKYMKNSSNHDSSSNVTNGMPLVKKRGRPRKTNKEVAEVKEIKEKNVPPLNKERNLRKRKIEEDTSPNESTQVTHTEIQRREKRIKSLRSVKNDTSPVNGNDANDEGETNGIGEDDKKKMHECPFPGCHVKFSREKALLCHMRNHNDDFEESLKCHQCDIPFDDLYSLKSHVSVCKGLSEEKDEDYDAKNLSSSHGSSEIVLRKNRNHLCTICGKGYVNQEKLER